MHSYVNTEKEEEQTKASHHHQNCSRCARVATTTHPQQRRGRGEREKGIGRSGAHRCTHSSRAVASARCHSRLPQRREEEEQEEKEEAGRSSLARRLWLVVVHVHVAGQARALGEAHGAPGAAERPLGRVAAQVPREVAADAEAAAAHVALEGLLARVGAQVPLEVHLPVERLGAQRAREGAHPRVRLLVVHQVARAARQVAAVAARQPRLGRRAAITTTAAAAAAPTPREDAWKKQRKATLTRSAFVSRFRVLHTPAARLRFRI